MRLGMSDDVYKDVWQWQEGEYTVTRSCQWSGPGCHNGCSVLFYTKDNKLVKIEGDPKSPVNDGRLCMRCLAMVEAVNHPDRVTSPMKRVGERGENRWERISWDEAYDTIVSKAREITDRYGAKSISTGIGTGRNAGWQTSVLAYAGFKTPNDVAGMLSGDACYSPRLMAMTALFGHNLVADCGQFRETRFEDPEYEIPKMVLVWGNNTVVSNADGFFGHWLVDCMRRGTKLMVVDTRLTWLAAKAEVWLQPRPGTDAAVALGMLNVLINEDLIDHEFVEKWCFGYDQFKDRIMEYPPERCAEISWVPAEKIRSAARVWAAAKPAALQWGVSVDQSRSAVGASQAIAALPVMTGNIDIPGSFAVINFGFVQNDIREAIAATVAQEVRPGRLGDDEYPIRTMGYSSHALADSILEAMETEEPYPVKMLFLCSTNPIANMAAQAPRVYEAMKKMEFNVVCDLFLTPTAVGIADIFLPVAMGCERSGFRAWWTPLRSINKVVQTGECKADEEIMLDLGKRLNPELFPWNTVPEFDEFCMNNLSSVDVDVTTTAELREKVFIYPRFDYRKHEKGLLRADGKPGFNTSTGMIELYCSMYEAAGQDPLPYFIEPTESPVRTPELMEEYPFVLTTGARSWEFFHSEQRQMASMREFHPDPIMEIHPEDAAPLGIKDGDWVWLENGHGKCKQRARVTPTILKGVVNGEHGWWFPERDGAAPSLFGVFDANINNLTTMCDVGPSSYGAPYRTQICKVYRA